MVSVFDGQLSRTWFFENQNRKHVINLYHDTITGVRSASVDYVEIRGSTGNSSVLMDSRGHRIFFSVDDLPGYLEIRRSGWTGFTYVCVISGKTIPESTEQVSQDQEIQFKPKVISTTLTPDEKSEHPVTWYLVQTTRVSDGAVTAVHRRFRDFAELNSQVKQNLKGNHLLTALPPLPEKPLKSLTDHRDPQFIAERSLKLEVFIASMVAVPHVADMVCMKAFLGLMEQVREFSLSFHVPTLGLSLIPGDKPGDASPAIVSIIQKPELCEGVQVGDAISKINGLPVSGYTFEGVVMRIRYLQRPVIIHFVQVIGGGGIPGTTSLAAQAASFNLAPPDPKAMAAETAAAKATGGFNPGEDELVDSKKGKQNQWSTFYEEDAPPPAVEEPKEAEHNFYFMEEEPAKPAASSAPKKKTDKQAEAINARLSRINFSKFEDPTPPKQETNNDEEASATESATTEAVEAEKVEEEKKVEEPPQLSKAEAVLAEITSPTVVNNANKLFDDDIDLKPAPKNVPTAKATTPPVRTTITKASVSPGRSPIGGSSPTVVSSTTTSKKQSNESNGSPAPLGWD